MTDTERSYATEKSLEHIERILGYLTVHPDGVTLAALTEALGMKERNLCSYLRHLARAGRVHAARAWFVARGSSPALWKVGPAPKGDLMAAAERGDGVDRAPRVVIRRATWAQGAAPDPLGLPGGFFGALRGQAK